MKKIYIFFLPFFLIFLAGLFFINFSIKTVTAQETRPTLADAYAGLARFGDEERVCVNNPESANYEYDFDYQIHDSGMSVVEFPEGSGVLYYFAEWWKNGPYSLEPHIYRSTDGGKIWSHLGKIFDIVESNATDCKPTSTTAYWDLFGTKYCLFQMREPHAIVYNGAIWITYEAAATDGKSASPLLGPAVVRLANPGITSAQTVVHGGNLRQHPLFVAGSYDADPSVAGKQTISGSTPVFYIDGARINLFWAGVYSDASGNTQPRVDGYRGHFQSVSGLCEEPGGCVCSDPMFCYFAYDEYLATAPNLPRGAMGAFDAGDAEIRNIFKIGGWNYLVYHGSYDSFPREIGIARSAGLTNWVRLYGSNSKRPSFFPASEGNGLYATFVFINGEYWSFYYDTRPPGFTGAEEIARVYRARLLWNDEPNIPDTTPCYTTLDTTPPTSPTGLRVN